MAGGTKIHRKPSQIRIGELFQDRDRHPVICLDRTAIACQAVSLVDGSCRDLPFDDTTDRLMLTLDEAVRLGIFGPNDLTCSVSRFWWKEDRLDRVAVNYASLATAPARMATDNEPMLLRGDFYEAAGGHPCLCLWILEEGKQIGGISLLDGSCPAFQDLSQWCVLKLTMAEAWSWRQNGPQDIDFDDDRVGLMSLPSRYDGGEWTSPVLHGLASVPLAEIQPGHFFEDLDGHPALCVSASGHMLQALSLVNGSQRERPRQDGQLVARLGLDEAIYRKYLGPRDESRVTSERWWESHRNYKIVQALMPSPPVAIDDCGRLCLSRGDLYESCSWHHQLCIGCDGDDVWGISLVDGSYPSCSLTHCGVTRLTLDEAWRRGFKVASPVE